MADSSRVSIRVAPETVWGTPPAGGPTWREVPFTSVTPRTNLETIQSNIIVSDAQVQALIKTAKSGAPEFGFEVGFGWLDELWEGALRSDFTVGPPSVLENGILLKSFSIEVAFLDINQFILFTGCRVNTLDLNVEVGQIFTGNITFLGKSGTISGTTSAGAFTPAPAATPINNVDNITLLEEGSTTLGDGLALSISINNNARVQPVLAQDDPRGIGLGQIVVTGTLRAYFEDASIYSKFLGFVGSDLAFEVTDAAGDQYLFEILAFHYSGGDPDVGGNNEDVDTEHAWSAEKDPVSGKTIRITRTDVP